MCIKNDIEDEYHFILECSKYVEIRRKYIKPYYCINPSAFIILLLSVQNIKELNNYVLCIIYHVLFVICIYISISCIAFGIKYYYCIIMISQATCRISR